MRANDAQPHVADVQRADRRRGGRAAWHSCPGQAGKAVRGRRRIKALLFRYNALFRWVVYLVAFVLPVGLTVLVNLYRLS